MEIASLAASLGSVLIAIIAIWLSITFYRLSSEMSEATREAAKGIGASVERLEKIFDRLYSDTFSMMKDTVSDMRRHMWPERESASAEITAETEAKAEEKLEALRVEMERSIEDIVGKFGQADEKIQRLTGLMEHVMKESRRAEVEARETTLRRTILSQMRVKEMRNRTRGREDQLPTADDIVTSLGRAGHDTTEIISELMRMRDEGLIDYDGFLRPSTEVRRARRRAPAAAPADERPKE